MISVDNEVKIIEEILGQPYGEIPRVMRNNLFNRLAMRFLFDEDFSFKNVLKEGSKGSHFLIGLNCIFLGKEGTESHRNYGKIHELTHARYLRNSRLSELTKQTLADTSNIVKTLHSILHSVGSLGELPTMKAESIEQSLIARYLNEGLAEYIAIQCQRTEMARGKKERTAFIISEKDNSGYEGELKDPVSQQHPLSLEFSSNLRALNLSLFPVIAKTISSLTLSSIKDKEFVYLFRDSMNMLGRLYSEFSYYPGYIYVRSALHERTSNLGPEIDNIIQNPPRTLDEFFGNIGNNLKFATTCP